MIIRTWKGWTRPENADHYERLLRTEIFPGILNKRIPGLRGVELLRRNIGLEIEFMTVIRFDDLDSVRQLAGPDHERAYVPDAAHRILCRFAETAEHFETREVSAVQDQILPQVV